MRIQNERSTPELISYQTLRAIVGALGMALPPVLYIWGQLLIPPEVAPSISAYYDYRTRDALVGALVAIGVFLFAYRGYGVWDQVVGKAAALSSLGVAFFPVHGNSVEHALHLGSAALMFICLAVFSLVLFVQKDPSGRVTAQKIWRNRVYYLCGTAIVLSMVFIAALMLTVQGEVLEQNHSVLKLETVALEAFGIAWFVKGEPLPFLRDKPTPGVSPGPSTSGSLQAPVAR
jgi:hypothetical protein